MSTTRSITAIVAAVMLGAALFAAAPGKAEDAVAAAVGTPSATPSANPTATAFAAGATPAATATPSPTAAVSATAHQSTPSTTASKPQTNAQSKAPSTTSKPASKPSSTSSTKKPSTTTCGGMPGGSPGGAPGKKSALGVGGTTSADLAQFAQKYNAIRVAHCLPPIPPSHFRYDSCMEQRLFWIAEDPSSDPSHNWGHTSALSAYKDADGVTKPIVGCDGNLAGGLGDTGATVAQKWWTSADHRASLYQPNHKGSVSNVCIHFAMTHNGIALHSDGTPYLAESNGFVRAAAAWEPCG